MLIADIAVQPYAVVITGIWGQLDIYCDWKLHHADGEVVVSNSSALESQAAELQTLVGQALVTVECPDDVYNPVFTASDGTQLVIDADYDGDPWHITTQSGLDLEGPGPSQHDSWLQGNTADEPETGT